MALSATIETSAFGTHFYFIVFFGSCFGLSVFYRVTVHTLGFQKTFLFMNIAGCISKCLYMAVLFMSGLVLTPQAHVNVACGVTYSTFIPWCKLDSHPFVSTLKASFSKYVYDLRITKTI